MEQFATEEQQVEAIKQFWKDHGVALIVGAIVGLGGLWAWRYYSQAQIESQEQTSAAYQQTLETLGEENDITGLNSFISEHSGTGYASLAALIAAQQAVENKDYATAAEKLKVAASSSEDASLAAIASIRLARVQLELDMADEAFQTISSVDNEAFANQVSEVKGDILVQQNKLDAARQAYTSALENNAGNPLVQMKLANLSAVSGSN